MASPFSAKTIIMVSILFKIYRIPLYVAGVLLLCLDWNATRFMLLIVALVSGTTIWIRRNR
jgi:hypothetical protein